MKHTPAPWNLEAVRNLVNESPEWADASDSQCEADAHLITAAPEMLAALNEVDTLLHGMLAIEHNDVTDNVRQTVMAAIAKATGAAPSQPKRSEAEKLVDALRDAGLSPRSYSGRGMLGAECVGVSVDRLSELDGIPMQGVQAESLGRGLIAYWPRHAWSDEYEG